MNTKTTNNVPRITGLLILEVRKSNPNGDPERESSPRQRPDGKGEVSPVSVKRKLRDLVLEKEGVVWQQVKTNLGITEDQQFQILESRGRKRDEIKQLMESPKGQLSQAFKDTYWDGRLFGNTFLEEGGGDTIRAGVAHFGVGVSIAPIEVEFSTWTNKAGVEAGKDRGMAPMAFRVVKHGLYTVPFFVNPKLAHKTGCTELDVKLMLELLPLAYAHTRSVVRTMVDVVHAHTLTHANPVGSVSDFALLDALTPRKKSEPNKPSDSLADYTIPTWADIKEQAIRPGAKKTFGQCGSYRDYTLDGE
jgi:CRISPR-associated protein Csd2